MNHCFAHANTRTGSVKRCYGLQTCVAETRSEAEDKWERVKACIPLEGALAWVSGHFGPDFTKMKLTDHVKDIEIPGIQGLFESMIHSKGGEPVTVEEGALYYAQGMGMPLACGNPKDVADTMEYFMDEGGGDGFMLAMTYTPGCVEEFVDLVVPELQRRGRLRTEYRYSTLRENMLEED